MKNKFTFLLIFFIALYLSAFEVFASNDLNSAVVGSQSGQVQAGTVNPVDFTVTLSTSGSGGGSSYALSLTGSSLPTGATYSFSSGTATIIGTGPWSVTLPSSPSLSSTIILTITNSVSTPQGTTLGITIFFDKSGAGDVTSGSFSYVVDAPVPVELTSFSANISEGDVNLQWNTATEVNNYGFEILRSAQNDKWDVLGFVAGHGNSNSPKNYNFTDDEVNAVGKYSYRLKQIDNDGTYKFSKTIEISFDTPLAFQLNQNYPNPFNPSTSISFNLPESDNVSLKIFNSIGEEVATLINGYIESGVHIVTFNAETLPSGVYIYLLKTNESSLTRKMLYLK